MLVRFKTTVHVPRFHAQFRLAKFCYIYKMYLFPEPRSTASVPSGVRAVASAYVTAFTGALDRLGGQPRWGVKRLIAFDFAVTS